MIAAALLAAALAAPSLDVMVVGRSGRTLAAPRTVAAKAAGVRVGGKRCKVAAGTPLAALLRTGLRLRVKDFGDCGGRPVNSGALYVRAVSGQAERGTGGWVYKVGDRTSTAGAADVSARVRRGRVLWYFCRAAGRCQDTLGVRPAARTVAPGATLSVTVRAYDDQGRGTPAAGASVAMGAARAVAGDDGRATLTVPDTPGRVHVVATQRGRIRSFAEAVRVG